MKKTEFVDLIVGSTETHVQKFLRRIDPLVLQELRGPLNKPQESKSIDEQFQEIRTKREKACEWAIKVIKVFEGFRYQAYPDPGTGGDPWTIGYGTTRYTGGNSVKSGDTITEQQASEYLIEEVKEIYEILRKRIPHWSSLNYCQQAALLSFAYNLGAYFYGSVGFNTISRNLKNKNYQAVPSTLMLYVNGGSGVLPGLVDRREKEGELWKCNPE